MAHSFLDEEPPPGYIAGLGRGATGFVTQADLGSTAHVTQRVPENDGRFDDADEQGIKYTDGTEEKEDEEADEIFDEIETKLRKKRAARQKRRGASRQNVSSRVQVEVLDSAGAIKAIGEDFRDEKNALSSISEDQWLNLPESGDFTRKTKRRRMELQAQQRFYRNSDAITAELRNGGPGNTPSEPENIDLAQISLARDKVLKGQLSHLLDSGAAGSIGSDNSVDKEEYIQELSERTDIADSQAGGSGSGISGQPPGSVSDYGRIRSLFKKLRRLEPHKAENWIAGARLEASVGKLKRARDIIEQGCDRCPQNEEIWLVSLEIHSSDIPLCRVLVADAIQNVPSSVKLWLKASEYEESTLLKKRVLMRALEEVPHSEMLWLEMVRLEEDQHMKKMILRKATQLVPMSIQLWTCLIRADSSKEIASTIEAAGPKVDPGDVYKLWLSGAKFEEEATGNGVKVERYVQRCFSGEVAASLGRDEWFSIACQAENEKHGMTARAIVWNCIELGAEKLETGGKLALWESDIEKAENSGNVEVVRAIYTYMTSKFKANERLWMEYATFESTQHDTSALHIVYEMAIENCPHTASLYCDYARSVWKVDGNVDKAEQVLLRGIKRNGQCEDLWLLYAKLEWYERSPKKAGEIYETCKSKLRAPSARVWYKHATLERCLGNSESAIRISRDGLKLYSREAKFYLQLSQIYQDQQDYKAARDILDEGVKMCPASVRLWTELASVYDEKLNRKIKARSTLEEGMALNPKSDLLYVARLKLEGPDSKPAEMILSKGLREIPDSGYLWSEKIRTAQVQHRKNLYSSSLNSTKDNPMVILTIARDLWERGKLAKAKQFFDACIEKDKDFGDCYVFYMCFLRKHGSVEEVSSLEKKLEDNDPHGGPLWCKIIKDIENWDKKPVEMLRRAADEMSQGV